LERIEMPKETLAEMEARHSEERTAFRKNCKHRNFEVLKACQKLNTGYQPITNFIEGEKPFVLGPDHNYDAVLIRCADCGEPMLCLDHHGLSVYVQPHYMTKGLVLPPDPFEKARNG
jgi:hypothetical protein